MFRFHWAYFNEESACEAVNKIGSQGRAGIMLRYHAMSNSMHSHEAHHVKHVAMTKSVGNLKMHLEADGYEKPPVVKMNLLKIFKMSS